MSFLTTQPEELAAAAGKLETIGSAMVAQNAAAAAPTTTGVIPAAADEISVLQAPLFTAYGTLYQQVSAEAAAVYDLFVKTLGVSAGTYAATEAANSSAAASPLSGIASILGSTPGKVPSWISDIANIFNIGAGNWASAASDLLGLASGGLLPAAEEAALEEGLEGAGLSELGAAEAAPVRRWRVADQRTPQQQLGGRVHNVEQALQRRRGGGLSARVRASARSKGLNELGMKRRHLSAHRLIGLAMRGEQRRDGRRHLISTGCQKFRRRAQCRGVGGPQRRPDVRQIRSGPHQRLGSGDYKRHAFLRSAVRRVSSSS